MKILLLVGKSNIGKTTVLNMLIEELKKIEYKVNMIEENNVDKVVKCIKGNFSIGINTQGDDFDSVKKVEKIKDCDLIICACRTKGETMNFFVNHYNNENLTYYYKQYIEKHNLNEELINMINNNCVVSLIKIIDEAKQHYDDKE